MGHKIQMYENLRDMLEREIGEIERKRDLNKDSLDNLFKLTSSLKVVEKCLEKKEHEEMMKSSNNMSMMSMGGQSMAQGGGSYENNSMHYPYMGYPMSMTESRNSFDGMSNARGGQSNAGDSYDGQSYANRGQYSRGQSNEGGYSGENSNGRRGRDGDGDGRYNESRDNFRDNSSRESYDGRGRSYGYSRDAAKKKMVQKLETLMDDTMSEKERQAIQECISEIDK